MITIRQVQSTDRNLNQLQQNIKQPVEAIFTEFVGNFTGTFTGFTSQLNTPVTWQTGTNQNTVSLRFLGTTATSNTIDMSMIGLPTNLWPKSVQIMFMRVVDNGSFSVGLITITPEGLIVFTKDVAGSSFTAAGSKGIATMTVTYVRNI